MMWTEEAGFLPTWIPKPVSLVYYSSPCMASQQVFSSALLSSAKVNLRYAQTFARQFSETTFPRSWNLFRNTLNALSDLYKCVNPVDVLALKITDEETY